MHERIFKRGHYSEGEKLLWKYIYCAACDRWLMVYVKLDVKEEFIVVYLTSR
jgi:hypothetical protein